MLHMCTRALAWLPFTIDMAVDHLDAALSLQHGDEAANSFHHLGRGSAPQRRLSSQAAETSSGDKLEPWKTNHDW